jgi:hypothetical protein
MKSIEKYDLFYIAHKMRRNVVQIFYQRFSVEVM